MNNFLLFIAAVLVLVLTALFAVPPMVNWNDFRGAFEEEASRLLDREVRVRGEVSVRILPVPYVSFEKVRIADAPGISGSFARAEQFKMWLSVPPLLRGVIEARQIELEQPVIRLRTQADGGGNWSKLQINKSNLAFVPTNVALKSVLIKDGTLLFESHNGHEITKLTKISGEMTAGALAGPYRFIGEMPVSEGDDAVAQEVRLSTAAAEDNGDVRFSGSVRSPDGSSVHSINGTLSDLLGSARAVGRITSRSHPQRSGGVRGAGYELAADLKLDAEALRLDKIAITFQNKNRQQTLAGSAITSWREGVATQTDLKASWLDLDAIAGSQENDGPLRTIERLLTRGIEPLGAGVTSLNVAVDQANLAGSSISDLKGRMVRRDGVTKIEFLRASLPGLSALSVDGFLERRADAFQFDGHVLMRSASFTELAQWSQIQLTKQSSQALATSFSLNSNVRVRSKNWQLSDMIVQLADATAEGEVAYDWSSRPVVVAAIDADHLAFEKFGSDLLAPARIAAFLGFPSKPGVDKPSADWLPDTDIALNLRTNHMTDGKRSFEDVDVEFSRTAEGLRLGKFKLTWQPGLKLALSGKLANLRKQVTGQITGTVYILDEKSADHVIKLASLAISKPVPSSTLAGRLPLRLAVTADLGKTSVGDKAKNHGGVVNQLVADGTMGRDRIRIDAQTFGPLADWYSRSAEVHLRVDGDNALVTTRRLLGVDTNASDEALVNSPPVTVVATAAGTPAIGLKAFARLSSSSFLDADFSGTLNLPAGNPVQTAWSGQLDIRQTSSRALALLSWPNMYRHVADAPIRGRIQLASTANGLRVEPKALRIGAGNVSGQLDLSQSASLPKLTGDLAFSDASLAFISTLVMRAGRGTRKSVPVGSRPDSATPESTSFLASDATAGSQIWPDTPFDFAHLSGVETKLGISIKKLELNANGGQLENASFQLETAPDRVTITKFNAHSGKATLEGNANFLKSQAGVRVKATVSGDKISLEQWAPTLAEAQRVKGSASIQLELAGLALSPRSLSTAISGKGSIRLTDAIVPGLTSETATAIARKIIDGELDVEALNPQLQQLVKAGAVKLGDPVLNVRIADGTLTLPAIVFDQDAGGLRNQTFIDLPRLRIDSQWTITPAPQPRPDAPDETVALPRISVVYAGTIADINKIEPQIDLGDLERELVVRRMEANVARLEQLRREDEARAAAEAERLRKIEEEQRRALEEERLRRQQVDRSENASGDQQSGASPTTPVQPGAPASVAVVPVPGAASQSATTSQPNATRPTVPRPRRARRRPPKQPFNPFSSN